MIRTATHEDVDRLLELGFREYSENQAYRVGMNFSYMHMAFSWHTFINEPKSGLTWIVEEDGKKGICGYYVCHFAPNGMDHTQIVCHEVAWYVLPEHRGKGMGKMLLKACQRESFSRGIFIHKVGFATGLEAKLKLSEWYTKMGYAPFQTEYFKILTAEDVNV